MSNDFTVDHYNFVEYKTPTINMMETVEYKPHKQPDHSITFIVDNLRDEIKAKDRLIQHLMEELEKKQYTKVKGSKNPSNPNMNLLIDPWNK